MQGLPFDAAVAALTTTQLIDRLQQEETRVVPLKVGSGKTWRTPALDYAFSPLNSPGVPFRSPSQIEPRSPIMIELVRRGPAALPLLLEHLSDDRVTGCYVLNPRYFVNGSPLGFADQYLARSRIRGEPTYVNRVRVDTVERIAEDDYKLRVGDLCFAAIGQIVNRRLHLFGGGLLDQSGSMHVRSSCVNSPVHSPLLARATREDWSNLTPTEHMASLRSDALTYLDARPDSDLAAGGVRRLLFYYPGEGVKTAETLLAQLPTSTFEHYADQLIADITPFAWAGRDASVFAFAQRLMAWHPLVPGHRAARYNLAHACRDLLLDSAHRATLQTAIDAERSALIAEKDRALADLNAPGNEALVRVYRAAIDKWNVQRAGPSP